MVNGFSHLTQPVLRPPAKRPYLSTRIGIFRRFRGFLRHPLYLARAVGKSGESSPQPGGSTVATLSRSVAGFKGQAENTIDGKGRVPVPAKMRKAVSPDAKDTFVATRGEGQFVALYPLDYWEQEIESGVARLNNFDPKDREFIRRLYRWAEEVTMDSQGRIALPKPLAAFADLKAGSKARIIGTYDCLEVWDPEVHDRHEEVQEEFPYADLAKSVMGGAVA